MENTNQDARIFYEMGNTYSEQGDLVKALECFEKANFRKNCALIS